VTDAAAGALAAGGLMAVSWTRLDQASKRNDPAI
jgi:hypothetical protein